MKIVSVIRRLVRERAFYPIVGWSVDCCFRWVRSQDGWERMISAAVHVSLETESPIKMRTDIAEWIVTFGPYLSTASCEMLQRIDEIVQKHSQKVN